MSWRNFAWLTFLTAAAGASWYLTMGNLSEDPTPTTPSPIRSGYYIVGAKITASDDQGETLYSILAKEATQAGKDEPVVLSAMSVDYANGENSAWQISADSAQLLRGNNALSMTGNVRAATSVPERGGEILFTTSTLLFDPDNEEVRTDDKIFLSIGGGTLSATGMQLSLVDDIIHLKSNINGQFYP